MYCDRCGSELRGNEQFCHSCGKPLAPVTAPARTGRIASHLRVLGILWIVYSAMHLLGGAFIATVLPVGMRWGRHAVFGWGSGHFWLPGGFFGMLGGFVLVMSILGIIAGWGLLERKPWARALAIVFGCLALFSFPLGTALGIYTLWVLASSDSGRQYHEAT